MSFIVIYGILYGKNGYCPVFLSKYEALMHYKQKYDYIPAYFTTP